MWVVISTLGSPIFPSGCEGTLGLALESLQGATPKSPATRRGPPRGSPRVPAPLPLSPFSPPDRDRRGDSPAWSGRGSRSRVATRVSWSPLSGLKGVQPPLRLAFQKTQGNRLSCRDQEGRRGSEEAVPGPSVIPSREPGVSGDFWGSQDEEGNPAGLSSCSGGLRPLVELCVEPAGLCGRSHFSRVRLCATP